MTDDHDACESLHELDESNIDRLRAKLSQVEAERADWKRWTLEKEQEVADLRANFDLARQHADKLRAENDALKLRFAETGVAFEDYDEEVVKRQHELRAGRDELREAALRLLDCWDEFESVDPQVFVNALAEQIEPLRSALSSLPDGETPKEAE